MSGFSRKGEMNDAGAGICAGAVSFGRMALGHTSGAGTLFFLTGGTQRVVFIWVSRCFGGGEMRGFRWPDCTRVFPGSAEPSDCVWWGEGRRAEEC